MGSDEQARDLVRLSEADARTLLAELDKREHSGTGAEAAGGGGSVRRT